MFSFFSHRNNPNRPTRIQPGVRVTGRFGPLVANPNARPGKYCRRVRSTATGTVVAPGNGLRYWQVRCDQDNEVRLARTASLQIIDDAYGVPPNEVQVSILYKNVVLFILNIIMSLTY